LFCRELRVELGSTLVIQFLNFFAPFAGCLARAGLNLIEIAFEPVLYRHYSCVIQLFERASVHVNGVAGRWIGNERSKMIGQPLCKCWLSFTTLEIEGNRLRSFPVV